MINAPKSLHKHIGIFGKVNSGKSTLINAFTNQQVSIVSRKKGTTTDPVYHAMELIDVGPCMFIDTPGILDDTSLGKKRVQKTMDIINKCDASIIVFSSKPTKQELNLIKLISNKNIPIIPIINRHEEFKESVEKIIRLPVIYMDEKNLWKQELIERLKFYLAKQNKTILGHLIKRDDHVLLVMPQDIQSPQGRLILPQSQVLKELLDIKCQVTCTVPENFVSTINNLKKKPKLIITDSQVFDLVSKHKPKTSLLTSFSVLFAKYKGDIDYYLESVKVLPKLKNNSNILIAECCSHAPVEEDIGRVKIPRLIQTKLNKKFNFEILAGNNFPKDLSKYQLIIQCGACVFNEKYVKSRIQQAIDQKVPMTNYGITIAYLNNILDKISY